MFHVCPVIRSPFSHLQWPALAPTGGSFVRSVSIQWYCYSLIFALCIRTLMWYFSWCCCLLPSSVNNLMALATVYSISQFSRGMIYIASSAVCSADAISTHILGIMAIHPTVLCLVVFAHMIVWRNDDDFLILYMLCVCSAPHQAISPMTVPNHLSVLL